MKIYLAATFWFGFGEGQRQYERLTDPYLIEIARNVENRLESYHYLLLKNTLAELKATGIKVFVDSGAFSAWNLGATIDLNEYCNFLKENMDIVKCEDGVFMASVLDGIGDPLLTWQNQMAMEKQGIYPLPCFHFGEDEQYLDWYLKNYEYITIGGCVGRRTEELIGWLDMIWSRHILDKNGKPKRKVHGFGITSIPIMERYPWWSVDSTSWIQIASFGAILVPGFGTLHVSNTSPNRHEKGAHFNSLSEYEQKHIAKMIKQEGFDLDYLKDHYLGRAAYNLKAFQSIQNNINRKHQERTTKMPMSQYLF
jgi:hypothetical protein